MKKMQRYSKLLAWCLFIAFISLFLGVFSKASLTARTSDVANRIANESKTVVWGVKNDTKLFGYYNVQTHELEGFDIDIAKELTKRITGDANNAQFVEVSSKTRIPLLRNGNIDAIIATMTISPARQKVVDFTDVYFDAGQSLIVAENSSMQSVEDLTSADTVITVKGSTSAKNIRKAAPQANVIELETYAEGFTALQAGQGTALTTDSAILMGLLKGTTGYRLVGKNFTEEPYGIAVNKHQEVFLSQLNKALSDMKADGTYDMIYQKWFSEFIGKD